MADNLGYTEGSGKVVRSVDKGSVHAQVFVQDYGGTGAEALEGVAKLPQSESVTGGSIAASYGAELLTPSAPWNTLRCDNVTDGFVDVSLDGGATTAVTIAPGKDYVLNLPIGRHSDAGVTVKQSALTPLPSAGVFYATTI